MRPRIIGIGSPWGLDRLGWLAVDALAAAGVGRAHSRPELLKLDRPGPALLERLEGDPVILIDALDLPGEPGSLLRLDPARLDCEPGPVSGHGLGVAEALALGRALGWLPARLLVVGIASGTGPWRLPLSLPEASRRRLLALVGAELAAGSRAATA